MRYFKIYNLKIKRPFPDNGPRYVASNGRDQALYNEIQKIVGDEPAPNGVPISIEVDSWGELACVGDYYDHDMVAVICISEEAYAGHSQ